MGENNNIEQNTELDINHLMSIRRDKLKDLQEAGKDPFEITKYDRTNTAVSYTHLDVYKRQVYNT